MVPVTDLLHQSFATELQRIGNAFVAGATHGSPATALARHIFRLGACDVPVGMSGAVESFPDGRLDEAPRIAIAGFAVASMQTNDEQLRRWREGVRRLSRRQAFTRDHQTFVFRPAELIGVALGVQRTEAPGSALREWLVKIVARLPAEGPKTTAWNLLWNGYAAALLGVVCSDPLPARLTEFEGVEIALAIVLLSGAVSLSLPGFEALDRAELEGELLRRVSLSPVDERQSDRLAAIHVGLSLAVRSQLERHLSTSDGLRGGTRDALQILELLSRNFDRAVRALQKRHANRPTLEIRDEYDVQDLMHTLLLLHFDVVIPEDTVPARAGNRSRLDFLLKRERVIVETKMTRNSLGQSETHDELVADRDRYKAHPDCDVLVCFVYDPARRFHNAAAFEMDLNSDEDRPRMRVFVCPR